MKFFYIIIILLFIGCSNDDGIALHEIDSNKIDFVKTFGGTKNDVFKSVVKTNDGGYAVFGYSQSNDFDLNNKQNDNFDYWLMKFSYDDNLLFSKTFGGTDDDRGADIIATKDGGFALLGYSKSSDGDVSNNAGSQDFWILKVTKEGTISWQKTFGFSGADYGTTLLQTKDDGFLITGVLDVTASGGLGNSKSTQKQHAGGDVWVIKLDNSGNKKWSKFYGGSFTDSPFGVIETSDNGFIIAASSDSNDVDIKNNKGAYDFWILKINDKGILVWEKSFGGSEIDEPWGISATNDDNFIIVGDTRSSEKDVSNNNGGADLWMINISESGNLNWQKTIGASSFDVARSISKTEDNGFLISGSSRSTDSNFNNKGKSDAWILKVDSKGNSSWQKFIGGSEIEFLYDAIELENKSIIAVGESSSANGDVNENKGFSDALLIKIK